MRYSVAKIGFEQREFKEISLFPLHERYPYPVASVISYSANFRKNDTEARFPSDGVVTAVCMQLHGCNIFLPFHYINN